MFFWPIGWRFLYLETSYLLKCVLYPRKEDVLIMLNKNLLNKYTMKGESANLPLKVSRNWEPLKYFYV